MENSSNFFQTLCKIESINVFPHFITFHLLFKDYATLINLSYYIDKNNEVIFHFSQKEHLLILQLSHDKELSLDKLLQQIILKKYSRFPIFLNEFLPF